MSIDLLSTTGFGAMPGLHGIVHGIGVTTRIGGMYTTVGHMIGTGIAAMHGIITTTGARSVRDVLYAMGTMSYILL